MCTPRIRDASLISFPVILAVTFTHTTRELEGERERDNGVNQTPRWPTVKLTSGRRLEPRLSTFTHKRNIYMHSRERVLGYIIFRIEDYNRLHKRC